jgi:TusA-related sulfurtransferase
MFGTIDGHPRLAAPGMPVDAATVLPETAAPEDAPTERLDVRSLGPPKPLQKTLELLADLNDDVVLIQDNDRAPQHLYPKLADRGYEYETVETDDATVTVIWRP